MKNTFYTDSVAEQIALATSIDNVTSGNPTNWGLTAARLTDLSDAATALANDQAGLDAAWNAYQQARQNRNSSRVALVDNLKDVARSIYAQPGLTDGDIASTGLAVHDYHPSPSQTSSPTNLVANAFANGTVKLTWNRNGNGRTTTFLIESSFDGSEWTYAGTTTAARITLSGYAPGTATLFRVTANRAGGTSEPSETAGIYLAMPFTLELAA